MKVKCNCGAIYQLSEKFSGKKVKCKKCASSFRVPDLWQQSNSDPLLAVDASNIGIPIQSKPLKKSAAQLKREREDALIAKHEKSSKAKGKSTEDFIADNFRDALESKRHDKAVYAIFYGIACFVLAVVLFIVMHMLEKGGVAPRIIVYLTMVYGKWWVPPIVFLIGVYQLLTGIMELADLNQAQKSRTKKKKK